ncbi:MAG TPA: FAD-binding oxidoreductase [Pseudolabrys sp.]|nr:FAD-binding oxidoreductase [Pseudolabrys sp.]
MNRRSLLKGAVALPLIAAFSKSSAAVVRNGHFRRVRPVDLAWPSQAQWDTLANKLSGKLIKPSALLADCTNHADGQSCRSITDNLHNPFFIGDQPSSTQVSGWFNAWTPAPSAYVVAAKGATDVAAAVDFARVHKLRLAVKGGGHSYQGTSNAADSLLIWTRPMHAITLHDRFVPQGCGDPPLPAVTVEAGVMWIDAYDAVTTRAGRYVQGGGCATVGVAGLIQSGGFGSFSKQFGMAAAGLLEAEIVTADGSVRIANRCSNSDLFWAIKGGGGGSFGVVTKLTLRTHDLPRFFGSANATIKAKSGAAFRSLIGRFMEFYAGNLLNPHWGEAVTFAPDNSLKIRMVSAGLSPEECKATFKPFFDWVLSAAKSMTITDGPDIDAVAARGWWDAEARRKRGSKAMIADTRAGAPATHAWWAGDQEQVGAYLYGYDSLWLPVSLLNADKKVKLVDALFESSRHTPVALHFNKGLAGAPAEAIAAAKNVATNPAVLDAFALAIVATGGTSRYPGLPGVKPDMRSARAGARSVDAAMVELRKLALNGGAYVSESNYFDRTWSRSFWGGNYARLRAIKSKYDPEGLFFVHHGVGSEDWSADGFVRLR